MLGRVCYSWSTKVITPLLIQPLWSVPNLRSPVCAQRNRHVVEWRRDRSSRLKGRQPREPMTRSKNMARIRSRDTVPEIRVSIALRQLGLGYRKHVTNLPGTPDFANRRRGWAIFVHGCFWHRHQGCRRATTPSTRAEYWIPKLAGNADRDNENAKKIEQLGLRVLVIWECQTRDVETIEDVLIRELIAWPD